MKNWSGNLEYNAANVFYPASVGEVCELVKKADSFKALGTRHCFNNIADTDGSLISTKALNKIVSIDAKANSVTVESGIKYGELCPYLNENNFALHNLASLPHISVGGSCSTATHGSGVNNGNLATAVTAIELVTPQGDVLCLSDKDEEIFFAAVVGLGAFGVVTKVSLQIQQTYLIRQNVYENLPLSELKKHFIEIVSAGYSVSLFTNWQTEFINEVWIKSLAGNNINYNSIPEFFGAKAAKQNLHPIAGVPAENCTEQMGLPGPWHERLPHFRMGFTPSSGVELQTEYFVDKNYAIDAILAVQKMGKVIGPYLLVSEIRTIAADNFWMSPCYKQQSVAIHFTWKQDWEAVSKLLPLIEKELEPYKPRAHWGKLFTMSSNVLASRYEKLEYFKKLALKYDPQGKMHNRFLKAVFKI